MADEPRSIPIHPSLHRPEQVMGGEREPVMCAALLSIITGLVGAVDEAWPTVLLAISFYVAVVYIFRQMARFDPSMTKVWLRFIRYQSYYPARSSYWQRRGYGK